MGNEGEAVKENRNSVKLGCMGVGGKEAYGRLLWALCSIISKGWMKGFLRWYKKPAEIWKSELSMGQIYIVP